MRPDLAEIADRATLYRPQGCEWTHVCRVGVLRFFYRLDGSSAAPARPEAAYREGIPDYVLSLAGLFEEAYRIFTEELGLADPLVSGRLAAEGVKHLDFVFDDIPKQRGIVPGRTVPAEACLREPGEEMRGRSLRIRLHRDLIEGTATPIHELFHVFQYGYAPFTNAWFMEGLARWSQNLTHRRPMHETELPQTMEALKSLLDLAHDAEYFWRELFRFRPARQVVRVLLEEASRAARRLENDGSVKTWDRESKRAFVNDRLLAGALARALGPEEETDAVALRRFTQLCRRFAEEGGTDYSETALQRFYEALETTVPGSVEIRDGKRICRRFDPATGRLRIGKIRLEAVSRDVIDAFEVLESLEGELEIVGTAMLALSGFNRLRKAKALRITANERLESLDGFNALAAVGELTVRKNPSLERIGGFRRLISPSGRFGGALRIVDNGRLGSVAFLSGLRETASSLYLHHNALASLEGLESLERVGASLSLASNRIGSLAPLSNLRRVDGMLGLANNRLESLDGLEKLAKLKTVRWNGVARTIALHGNPGLRDLRGLRNVETEQRYLIVSVDDIGQYESKPDVSDPFHRNILELYDYRAGKIVPTRRFVRKKTHDYGRFRKATHLGTLSHLVDFEVPSDTLVISFSGYNGFLGGMFHNRYPWITATHPSHKLFVLDRSNSWYHLGIPGLANDLPSLLSMIESLIAEGGYRRVLCTGASMGGYASLLCATVPGVTDVIALSPQSFLDDSNCRRVGETRWKRDFRRVAAQTTAPEMLDVAVYWKTRGVSAERIQIHYARRIAADEAHALHLAGENVEHVGHDVDTHYLAAWLHGRGELRPLVLRALGADPERPRVLFGPKWKKATARCGWLDAFHLKLTTAEAVATFCFENDIQTLFGNNYTAQKWLWEHRRALREKGFRFIVNDRNVLRTFVDKRRFRKAMAAGGFAEHLPKLYASKETAEYPCIVKPPSGGAGRGVFVAEGPGDIPGTEGVMLEEYLRGEEYATSVFCRDGKLLHHRTYRKEVRREPFILQQEQATVTACETPFLPRLLEIVNALYGAKGYCMCSLNYKITDGIPKIFEINPRTGYTLAQHPEDFREFMACYLEEAKRERNDGT